MPQEIIIDERTLVAADLDMALIQSYKLSGIVYAALRKMYRGDVAALDAIAQVETTEGEQVGQDFPYMDQLKKGLESPEAMSNPEAFARQIANANRGKDGRLAREFVGDIMIDGATEYLQALQKNRAHWLIMTAGGEFSQRFKMELLRLILVDQKVLAGGMGLPFIVTESNKGKADLLYGAVDDDGWLVIDKLAESGTIFKQLSPSLEHHQFASVILTDDKTHHLDVEAKNIPSHARGIVTPILVKRGGNVNEPGVFISDVVHRIDESVT